MTRTLTFSPRIWDALDAGELTLPVARALQLIEDGATIYSAAQWLDMQRHGETQRPPKALRRLQIAWADLTDSARC